MNTPAPTDRYKNHRFPIEIISHAVWLYFRFCLSYRDVEELLFVRGVIVSHEAIRKWCHKFGQAYANQLRRRGFVKKGQDSVGVARQYCGPLGKVENCQVGVFAGYASRQGYALVDKRLFLPEAWFTDAYATRRTKCNVAKELTLQSKPQLAAAMLRHMVHEGLLPFRYIVADCLYGTRPAFLDAVEACVGITALVAIPSETRCWLQRPRIEAKRYRYQRDARSKQVVADPDSAPSMVATVAACLPASSWYRRKVSEGTKGPITYEFARQRVTLCKNGLPDRTVWLVIKRTLGAEPSYAYALSNAPASLPLSTLVWLSGLRWAVEQGYPFNAGPSVASITYCEGLLALTRPGQVIDLR